MTVILALKGRDHVVVAADTLETRGDGGGFCRLPIRKLYKINGTWVIGVSGSLDGIQIVRDLGEDKIPELSDYACLAVDHIANKILDAFRKKNFKGEAQFLLSGIDNFGKPLIWDWSFRLEGDRVVLEGPREQASSQAIGAAHHGALYFASEFHRDNMSVEQNVLLAFHCAAEVAKHDIRVRRPIDVAVGYKEKSVFYTESELFHFIEKSEQITASIKTQLLAEGLSLP